MTYTKVHVALDGTVTETVLTDDQLLDSGRRYLHLDSTQERVPIDRDGCVVTVRLLSLELSTGGRQPIPETLDVTLQADTQVVRVPLKMGVGALEVVLAYPGVYRIHGVSHHSNVLTIEGI